MEDNWIEVYGETLKHEALVRITDEIEKNSDFVIDKSNVRDYFDCDSFLDVLESNNIEYNIELKRPSEWNEKGQHSYGEVTLFVYIKESDEEKLTYSEPNYFDLPEELQGVNLNEPEEDNEDGPLEKGGKLFMNMMLVLFLVLFMGLAISAEDEAIRRVYIIIGLISVIALLKVNKKKKVRRIQ